MNDMIPEGCKLVAVMDGHGSSAEWGLCVEDENGKTVAMLRWPEFWPEKVKKRDLERFGFKCVIA